jgi:hypothetical protein
MENWYPLLESNHCRKSYADDFISTADYQKALSEETEYRSSHKKKDGPTSQQKRKHHITYLAHQVLFSQYIYIGYTVYSKTCL